MITKSILITALSISALGGGGVALNPAIELAAGPVIISANGDTGFSTSMGDSFDMRLSVTLAGRARINIG
ncbi:MAG: hypothetical protein V3U82_05205 [Robiginitomaculum sp.]